MATKNGNTVTMSLTELRKLIEGSPKAKASKAKVAKPKANNPKHKGVHRVTEPTAKLRKATFGELLEGDIFRIVPSGADYPVTASELYGDLVTGIGVLVATDHPKGVEFDKPASVPCYIVG